MEAVTDIYQSSSPYYKLKQVDVVPSKNQEVKPVNLLPLNVL